MRLNAAQGKKIEDEFGIQTISEDHSVYPKLAEVFGDHTFLIDADGLNIVEPTPLPDSSSVSVSSGTVVRLASWTEDQESLTVQEPEVLSVKVDLQTDD